MKKSILFLFLFIFSACGVKQTQSMLTSGDYDGAINRAIEGLRTNKNAKSNQDYVYLLEESFVKAKERDEEAIQLLVKENNATNYERVYDLYKQLMARQDKIKPLLPLKLLKENRNALFPFKDYTDELLASKTNFTSYLYQNAKKLLTSSNKLDCREAYDDLVYLDQLNPNYLDVRKLIDEAQFKGTDFVYVATKNDTQMIIPSRLQDDLLDFGTLGLNDKWTVYHSKKQSGITYDFSLVITFRAITLSPEQVKEKQFTKEKQIKDGTKPLLDANGNNVKDQNGNNVLVDNMKTVSVSIFEFTQFKSCQVTAKVDFIDQRTTQLIDTFPLSSEYVFNYVYANFNGDKRACESNYYTYFDRRAVPFPSNEQMVYDSGEDLKAKLKAILTRNKFRK
jgi:uncharacterized Zn ribbon protein